MTFYRDEVRVRPLPPGSASIGLFEAEHAPGSTCTSSGIYYCVNCDHTIAANMGDPFPPQNHHQHNASKGPIRWRLLVWA